MNAGGLKISRGLLGSHFNRAVGSLFRGSLFVRLGLLGRCDILDRLGGGGGVHPLDDRHRCGVAHAGAELGDAAVTALAVLRSGSRFGEKFLDDFLLAEEGDREAAGMKIVALGECDQLFCDWTKRFRLTQCGFDAAVFDKAAHQIG